MDISMETEMESVHKKMVAERIRKRKEQRKKTKEKKKKEKEKGNKIMRMIAITIKGKYQGYRL